MNYDGKQLVLHAVHTHIAFDFCFTFKINILSHIVKGPSQKTECLAPLDPSQRNWFRISRLMTIIARGLLIPCAKSESGAGLVLV